MSRLGRGFPGQPRVVRARPGVQPLTPASISGTATVSVTPVAIRNLAPSISGAATVTATLVGTRSITASVSGASTVTAAVSAFRNLAPAISGSASVTATPVVIRKIAASISGSSTVTAALSATSGAVLTVDVIRGSSTVAVTFLGPAISGSSTVTATVKATNRAVFYWFEFQIPPSPGTTPTFTPAINGSSVFTVTPVVTRVVGPSVSGSSAVTVSVTTLSNRVATLLPLIFGSIDPIAFVVPAAVNGFSTVSATVTRFRAISGANPHGSSVVSVTLVATRKIQPATVSGSSLFTSAFFKESTAGFSPIISGSSAVASNLFAFKFFGNPAVAGSSAVTVAVLPFRRVAPAVNGSSTAAVVLVVIRLEAPAFAGRSIVNVTVMGGAQINAPGLDPVPAVIRKHHR